MESMETWEELKERLMELDERERDRALQLMIEVLDFIKKNPGAGTPGANN